MISEDEILEAQHDSHAVRALLRRAWEEGKEAGWSEAQSHPRGTQENPYSDFYVPPQDIPGIDPMDADTNGLGEDP